MRSGINEKPKDMKSDSDTDDYKDGDRFAPENGYESSSEDELSTASPSTSTDSTDSQTTLRSGADAEVVHGG